MQYSPERRTALVLCGTGAHGAYHAGVVRALLEAGVKIDVVAGHGVGAAAAMLTAVDGAASLWEAGGIWRSPQCAAFYRWRLPILTAARLALVVGVLVVIPPLLASIGIAVDVAMFLRVSLVLVAGIAAALIVGILAVRLRRPGVRRRAESWWWGSLGAPFDATGIRRAFGRTIWQLVRGAAGQGRASRDVAARRYAEVLAENIGQPGFRELLVVATDLDSRCDIVAAALQQPYRTDFLASRPGRERRAEALDLAGADRDRALDMMNGALTPAWACDASLMTFASEGFWRGETHRLCDRPGSVARLLEELADVGVSQAIIVSASPTASTPHRLRAQRLDVRSRIGEFIGAAEAASLADALHLARLRFDSIYVICPTHNPIGPFDFTGAYDEASDRRHSLGELMDSAYDDAYHQFIEPVVGASGEQLAGGPTGRAGVSRGQRHGQGTFDEADPRR